MTQYEMIYWNPIGDHKIEVSSTYGSKDYDSLDIRSIEQKDGLHIVLEDNKYLYTFIYVQSDPPGKFTEIYTFVETPEHMRSDLISLAYETLETKTYWPFFKATKSSLIDWSITVMNTHLSKDNTIVHHVFFTVDQVIEVVADQDPTIEITEKTP